MSQTIASLNGVRNYFGPQDPTHTKIPAKKSKVSTEMHVVEFRYDDLPAADANDQGILVIPKGSLIVSARLVVLETFAGGTSYQIGTEQTDGTDIDLDGLITDANAPLASINGAGKWVVGTGALVGAVSSLTVDSQVKVTATGTFTAGRARLYVEIIPGVV